MLLFFGCAFVRTVFCEQLLLASAFAAPRSCLVLVLRFFLDGVMVSVTVISDPGHAALPFPNFDLVFLFHLVGRLALALVTFFEILVCHCYFSFLSNFALLLTIQFVCLVSLDVGMLAVLWLQFFMGVFPFFPFA